MILLDDIPTIYSEFRLRASERDGRMVLVDSVVKGDFSVAGPDDEAIDNRSPNLIQVALEDTAEASSTLPSVRVDPSSSGPRAKAKADAMERLCASYLDQNQAPLLLIKTFMDYYAFGFFSWAIMFNPDTGAPTIQRRDPRTAYYERDWFDPTAVRRALFARELWVHELPPAHIDKIQRFWPAIEDKRPLLQQKVTLVEYFDDDEIVVAALVSGQQQSPIRSNVEYIPIELERMATPHGVCPVVIQHRLTLDDEPRGQFDQVVNVLLAHIRLMGMVLDYSDQAVYSDIWVKDLVGQMPYGGGAYIQLGPNGAIGRVPPAVSSLSVQQELQQIVDNFHVAARWPKSRPGEISQAIASAKFIEATAGMMNTVIRTAHLVMKTALERALRLCLLADLEYGADRTIGGITRNQQFLDERRLSDIDLGARVRVEYGLGLGRDVAQSMVLGIQAMQTGIASVEFVQENMEGITDVAQEQRRLARKDFVDMLKAQMLQGVQAGTTSPQTLVDIIKAIDKGDDIVKVFEEVVAKPQEEQAAAAMTSGLTGEQMMPGAPPGMGGPTPPPAPAGADMLARLGTPAGPGGMAGTQVQIQPGG